MRAVLLLLVAFVSFAAAPKPAPLNDAAVEANIRAKFAKSKISEEHFRVSVKSGVALIEGKTEIPQRKGVATRLAKNGGAREVVNKIQISEAARKKLADRLQKAREKHTSVKTPSSPKPAAQAPAAHNTPTPAPAAKPTSVTTPPASSVASTEPPPLRRMQIKR